MKKRLFFTFILLTLFFLSYSSTFLKVNTSTDDCFTPKPTIKIGFKTGIGTIIGDGQRFDGSIVYGLFIDHFLSTRLSLGLNFDFGSISSSSYAGYNYSGETSFFQTSLIAKYNLSRLKRYRKINKTSISPFLGAGIVFYNPQVSQKGVIIRYADGTASSPTSVSDLVLPFGVEFGQAVTPKLNLILAFRSNFLFTDRFNGTVGVSHPSSGIGSGHTTIGKISDKTGSSSYDTWLFLGLKVAYKIQ